MAEKRVKELVTDVNKTRDDLKKTETAQKCREENKGLADRGKQVTERIHEQRRCRKNCRDECRGSKATIE